MLPVAPSWNPSEYPGADAHLGSGLGLQSLVSGSALLGASRSSRDRGQIASWLRYTECVVVGDEISMLVRSLMLVIAICSVLATKDTMLLHVQFTI